MPTFRVIPGESPVSIDADTTMHPVRAQSSALSGSIVVAVDENGSPDLGSPYRAQLRLPVDTLRSGHNLQDREMHRRLDDRGHPEITVDVTEVTRTDSNGRYHATARITLRGQTRDIDGDVTISLDGDRLVVEGQRAIDMRLFGMEPPRLLMLKVQPEVTVRVRITAQREG